MKRAMVFLGGALLLQDAAALTLAPAGNFSATGRLALGKSIVPVSCLTTFTGNLAADGAFSVRTVTFSGSNFLCKRISALGLPWRGRADRDTQLTIEGMQVKIDAPLLGGVCGPVDVIAAWDRNESAAHFRKVVLPPNCRMDGVMVTAPHITVTP
jgi:hypothetical protein